MKTIKMTELRNQLWLAQTKQQTLKVLKDYGIAEHNIKGLRIQLLTKY